MGGTMTKVLPSLYIGGLENAKHEEQLIANCISHILVVVQTAKKELEYKSPSCEYLHIYISERDSRSLIRRIPETNTFIHTARLESGNVLVCSESGISTNSAVVAAYLMTVYALDSRSAVSAVQGLRHVALPIPSLLAQLDRFGADPQQPTRQSETNSSTLSPRETSDSGITVAAERQRLKEAFGDWPGYEEDIQHLHDAIRSFKSLSESGVLLHDPISPLLDMRSVTSCTEFEVSPGCVGDTPVDSSQATSTLHPLRTSTMSCKGLTRSKDVRLTPPSTPPTTPVCFPSEESFTEEVKGFPTPSLGSTTASGAGNLADSDVEFLKTGDCSPLLTLNETDLFPGDAPIIGIDDFAVDYCKQVAEHLDTVEPPENLAPVEPQSIVPPYEVGVELTGDADVDTNWDDDDDDDVPGAIEIRTGLFVGQRLSAPRTAASYHTGLTSFCPRQETGPSRATATRLPEGPRVSEPASVGAGRLSTTAPTIRSFLPFFRS